MNDIPIYYINLERSKDRRNFFENQIKEYNLQSDNIFRVEGIDGLNINMNEFNHKQDLTPFELCCTLSHLKAVQQSYENDDEYSLIMEDDCNFEYVKYQKHSIQELIEYMNTKHFDWHILQLCTCCKLSTNQNLKRIDTLVCKGNQCCTTCYLINKNGMRKTLNKDNYYNEADKYLYKNCNCYYKIKPYFTYNYSKDFNSNIHNINEQSNSTNYKREDENKKFWDNYYFT